MDWFRIEVRSGAPIQAGVNVLTPHSLVAQGLWPWQAKRGFIWNMPVWVTVRTPEGGERRLPVIDVTRLSQLAVVVWGLFTIFIFWRFILWNKTR